MKLDMQDSVECASNAISVPRHRQASAIDSFCPSPLCAVGLLLFAFGAQSLRAQPGAVANSFPISSTGAVAYSVATAGPHDRVWQGVTSQTNSSGEVAYQTNSYTEVATGLNHLVGNSWVESSENIQVTQEGGAATNGQHQVYFAGNINTAGGIHLVMADNQHLRSHIMGLAYFDSSSGKSVMIASLQDSGGQILPSLNQVIYTNAFSNLNADVRYTYTKSSLEQDVILRQQLPAPGTWGLNPQAVWLQVWTEFAEAPVPQDLLITNKANTWQDHSLDFGSMKMGRGNAFSLGESKVLIPVTKSWQVDQQSGRKFLVEQVRLATIAANLQKLPPGAGSSSGLGTNAPPSSATGDQAMIRQVYNHPVILARKTSRKESAPMRLASAGASSQGFVMDYVIASSTANYTFASDTTFYVNGNCNLSGTTTFEGGAVFKFTAYSGLYLSGTVVWGGGAYRPVVFTAKDDNTAGQTISGSTGTPSGYYGYPSMIYYEANGANLHGLRMSYAVSGMFIWESPVNIYDAQFINCGNGLEIFGQSGPILVGNSLFANTDTSSTHVNILLDVDGQVSVENSTFVGTGNVNDYLVLGTENWSGYDGFYDDGTFAMTNCVMANEANPQSGTFTSVFGNFNGIYNTSASVLSSYPSASSSTNPFQSAVAGSYYLSPGVFGNGPGTTAVDSSVLTEVKQRTTQAPLVYAAIFCTNSLTLYPGVQRDTNAANYGYHYDPIDYAFGNVMVSNATVTVIPGTVIAGFDTNASGYSLAIGPGGQFLAQGTPNNLVHIVNFNTVQERSTTNWVTPTNGLIVPNWTTNGSASVINCRFTDFSILANDTAHLFAIAGNTAPINFQDCQFHGGLLTSTNPTINLTNCLLERVAAKLWSYDGNSPYIRNNLFWHGTNDIQFPGITNALVQDNLFDQTVINDHGSTNYIGGYNGFVTNYNRLTVTNSDKILTVSPAYQGSWFGSYYLPTSSPLINSGNTNAALLALFHYTTTANQAKETNSTVDIGYHYVAANGSGLPISTSGDGIGDYLKDSNGNGTNDITDLGNWMTNSSCGDGTNDLVKYIQGRMPNICTIVSDTNGILYLQVYTPLK